MMLWTNLSRFGIFFCGKSAQSTHLKHRRQYSFQWFLFLFSFLHFHQVLNQKFWGAKIIWVYLTDPIHPGGHICLAVSSKVVDSLWGLDVEHELVRHSTRLVGQPCVHLQNTSVDAVVNNNDDEFNDYDKKTPTHLFTLVEVNNTFEFSRLK